ncbi:Phosphoribosyltransferase-like [Phytophthora cactorum]|nr:Phosphoribosyltransferase-like [Phytophthora cactorum]
MASPQLIKEMETKYPNLSVLQYRALAPLQIKLRDEKTTPTEFKFFADRLMRILAEEGLAVCANKTETVVTPTGDSFTGLVPAEKVCAVSIIRAGDSLLQSIIECDPTVSVGKILIQRDEKSEDKHAVMYYSKLPPKVEKLDNVLLVDPMLATGGSVNMAIKTLIDAGVEQKKITFLNVISCPEGLATLFNAFPGNYLLCIFFRLDVAEAWILEGRDCRSGHWLEASKYILPGLGDYGDRYYNTV